MFLIVHTPVLDYNLDFGFCFPVGMRRQPATIRQRRFAEYWKKKKRSIKYQFYPDRVSNQQFTSFEARTICHSPTDAVFSIFAYLINISCIFGTRTTICFTFLQKLWRCDFWLPLVKVWKVGFEWKNTSICCGHNALI
jgi:hypothetical protein